MTGTGQANKYFKEGENYSENDLNDDGDDKNDF